MYGTPAVTNPRLVVVMIRRLLVLIELAVEGGEGPTRRPEQRFDGTTFSCHTTAAGAKVE